MTHTLGRAAGRTQSKCIELAATGILSEIEHVVIRGHGSASLCRDGQKTKWRLQCKY